MDGVQVAMHNLSPYGNVSNSTIDLCPQTFNCTEKGSVSFDIGRAPSYVAIVSSALSCLGSFLVIATFLLLKDMRLAPRRLSPFWLLQTSSVQQAISLAPPTFWCILIRLTVRAVNFFTISAGHKHPSLHGRPFVLSAGH